MRRIYFYKLVADNLGAPHVADNLLTLAICKPGIRRTARPGDLILGFGGAALERRLIYAAVITEKLDGQTYYPKYQNRGDAIYSWNNGAYSLRTDALYHSDGTGFKSDVGCTPEFANARVLLSEDFRYFGKHGDASYGDKFPYLKERLAELAQGHRVNHTEELKQELLNLKDQLWKLTSPDPIVASDPVPTLANPCQGCNGDNDDDYEEIPYVC